MQSLALFESAALCIIVNTNHWGLPLVLSVSALLGTLDTGGAIAHDAQ